MHIRYSNNNESIVIESIHAIDELEKIVNILRGDVARNVVNDVPILANTNKQKERLPNLFVEKHMLACPKCRQRLMFSAGASANILYNCAKGKYVLTPLNVDIEKKESYTFDELKEIATFISENSDEAESVEIAINTDIFYTCLLCGEHAKQEEFIKASVSEFDKACCICSGEVEKILVKDSDIEQERCVKCKFDY